MAFKKIDWDAINNKTPEQREEECRAHYERLAERLKSLIEARLIMVKSLLANLQVVPEKHLKFVKDLEYKSTTYGREGLLGESLADLTDKQAAYLEGLYKSYGVKSALSHTERRPV
jgi:hypothetical protein